MPYKATHFKNGKSIVHFFVYMVSEYHDHTDHHTTLYKEDSEVSGKKEQNSEVSNHIVYLQP